MLTVQGALTGDLEAIHHAAMVDPLVGACCDLGQIRKMVDAMFLAEAAWLPNFAP